MRPKRKRRRQCGVCHVCCDLLSVEELGKASDTRCPHQANTGCKIFGHPERPSMCSVFACAWLEDGKGEFFHDLLRPDRCKIMVRGLPDDDDAEGMILYEAAPGAFQTEKGLIVLALGEFILSSEPNSRVELVFADGSNKTWLPGQDWKDLFKEEESSGAEDVSSTEVLEKPEIVSEGAVSPSEKTETNAD